MELNQFSFNRTEKTNHLWKFYNIKMLLYEKCIKGTEIVSKHKKKQSNQPTTMIPYFYGTEVLW